MYASIDFMEICMRRVAIILLAMVAVGCGKTSVKLSFDSKKKLALEEGELFSLPISIGKFKLSELKKSYPATMSDGRYSEPSLYLVLSITAADADNEYDSVGHVSREFRDKVCGIGGNTGNRVDVEEGDSKATFTNIYVDKFYSQGDGNGQPHECDDSCVLKASLVIRHGCGGGGACDEETISTITRPLKIKDTSHALIVTKGSAADKAIITATKDGQPLANAEMRIDAEQSRQLPILNFSPDPGCFAPTVHDMNKPVMTDANGKATITLVPDKERDFQVDVCKTSFSITADGRHFSGLRASGC